MMNAMFVGPKFIKKDLSQFKVKKMDSGDGSLNFLIIFFYKGERNNLKFLIINKTEPGK